MFKRAVRRTLRRAGYDLVKLPRARRPLAPPQRSSVAPIWPLPRADASWTDDRLRAAFAEFPHWHYAFAFEGDVSFGTAHVNPGLDTDDPRRPLQRFRHFMPDAIEAVGGSLAGKRVLDIACNAGFWSLQCALLGAEVVGLDGRPELIAQANLLKEVTGVESVQFSVLDFADMSPEALGTFDLVLNLGFLYHARDPFDVLQQTCRMARSAVLLDTAINPSEDSALFLKWEEPVDIRMAATAGIVAEPTRRAVELMLEHLDLREWREVPVRTTDLPSPYLRDQRAAWLLQL